MTMRPAPKPKRSKPTRKSLGKVEDRAYRDWIKGHRCLARPEKRSGVCSHQTNCSWFPGRHWVEAAHVRTRGAGGADRGNLVPLCPSHHDEQEGDTAGFEKVYGLRLAVEAAWLLLKYVEHIEK